jgi:hypothetical protein
MVVSLLHNMSVPPRSTIQVKRSALPGRRFFVDCAWLGPGSCQLLRSHGADALLPLIEYGRELLVGSTSEEAACDGLEAALSAAEVPSRVGVFIPAERMPKPSVPMLQREAILAVLARRSGPLYLPRRKFAPSLIVPLTGLLVFPED